MADAESKNKMLNKKFLLRFIINAANYYYYFDNWNSAYRELLNMMANAVQVFRRSSKRNTERLDFFKFLFNNSNELSSSDKIIIFEQT